MSILFYLIVVLVLLIVIFVLCLRERTSLLSHSSRGDTSLNDDCWKKKLIRLGYIPVIFALSIYGEYVAREYMYPSDPNVMKNTDCHVISHKGFEFSGSRFYLANGREGDSIGFPQIALWDNKEGIAYISGDSICLKNFIEPFYLAKSGDENEKFELQNVLISEDADGGFSIEKGGVPCCKLKIRYDWEKKSADYILTTFLNGEEAVTDTSGFHEVIKRGYPLYDIVARVPSVNMDNLMESLFSNSFLAREVFGDKESKLHFMPGTAFYALDSVTLNGRSYSSEYDKVISGIDSCSFYAGIGKKSTDQMMVRLPKKGDVAATRLEFAVPHMKRLRPINGCVFVTSALDNVDLNMKDGGYLFNIFEQEDNFNHISAYFRYKAGNSKDSLKVEVVDLYADIVNLDSDRNDGNYVTGSEEFLLSTKNKNDAASWIFEITDLRQANDLKLFHLALLLIIFSALVAIRICHNEYGPKQKKNRNLSYFELGVYLVLVCFAVVRFFLCWRISTYIPIENISPAVFNIMKGNDFVYTYFILIIPLALLIRPYIISKLEKRKSREKDKSCLHDEAKVQDGNVKGLRVLPNMKYIWSRWKVSIIYVLILGVCFGLDYVKIDMLVRICNIFIPVVCYFLFDILTIVRGYDSQFTPRRLVAQRVVNLLFTLAYLAIADAGFAVIFFIYSVLHILAVQAFYRKYNKWFVPYIISIVVLVLVWLLLRFEGGLMIFVLNLMTPTFFVILKWLIVSIGLIAICLVLFVAWHPEKSKTVHINRGTGIVCSLLIALFAVVLFTWINLDKLSGKIRDKSMYQRYRAEIQDLKADKKIDSLMLREDFNSKSIEYVMRSAHNQWFINQYLAAGDSLNNTDKLYQTQPHSLQGATYPTQTTDLVVTRYVLAEHNYSNSILFLLMTLFVLLVSIYIAEVQLEGDNKDAALNRAAIGGTLLLYVIALLVFLSATNRIVFVGQDFPFLSAQSKIAVLLPVMLMLIPAFRCQSVMYDRQTKSVENEDRKQPFVIFFLVVILLFTGCCTWCIERKGEGDKEKKKEPQKAEQFNVSDVIAEVAERVSAIDRVFVEYQRMAGIDSLKAKNPTEVWNDFEVSSYGQAVLGDTAKANDKFFKSLLHYFRYEQDKKTNPNEFLHLRRRNSVCHLSVNKKQFFIPAIMQDSLMWKGSLLAASIKKRYTICDIESGNALNVEDDLDYRLNILPIEVQRRLPGIQVYQFSESWTPDHKPLIMIDSKKSLETKQYFSIFSDTSVYTGFGLNNQIAMAIGWNDKFMLYSCENGNDAKVIYVRKLKESTDNYLACNIWLNGKRRLFFPLGKESMWSYQIATLMCEAYSDTHFRDSTIRLSIDYDLHKKIYQKISDEVLDCTEPRMTQAIRNEIKKYKFLSYEQKCDSRDGLLYFDEAGKRFVLTARGAMTSSLNQIVSFLNSQYRQIRAANPSMEPSALLSAAVNRLLEGNNGFDFSAVAIDGDGKIRLLLDYTTKRNIDPNNILHINKLLSELYCDGKTSDELDIFGNKALQYIVPGPGSSLKPIAYTAITSQENLSWETIDVFNDGQTDAAIKDDKDQAVIGKYLYYGGVNMNSVGEGPLNIESYDGLTHDKYLVESNNLYHSVMMMLGMQTAGNVEKVLKDAHSVRDSKLKFPSFTYNGAIVCFDRSVWFKNNKLHLPDNSLFGEGMWRNFRIQQNTVRINSSAIANYFGNSDEIKTLFERGGASKCWSFPLVCSQNLVQRKMSPQIRNGFNQILLGSYPLQLTPLQMAMNAYRMVTLNAADNIFTILDDDNSQKPKYEFFNIGESWNGNNDDYTHFVARQVWKQLSKVPTDGTAKTLKDYYGELIKKGYHLYCKTGTLNVQDNDASDDNNNRRTRVKHLLVVVSDKALEDIETEKELADVKFYVMYFSYYGVDVIRGFSAIRFLDYIKAVVESEVFDSYMKN